MLLFKVTSEIRSSDTSESGTKHEKRKRLCDETQEPDKGKWLEELGERFFILLLLTASNKHLEVALQRVNIDPVHHITVRNWIRLKSSTSTSRIQSCEAVLTPTGFLHVLTSASWSLRIKPFLQQINIKHIRAESYFKSTTILMFF